MTFAEKISLLKRHNGLSDRRLAEELDMSPKAIGNLIRRGATPRPWTARRIADFFEVGVSELLDDSIELDPAKLERSMEGRQWGALRTVQSAVHTADHVQGSKEVKQVVFELDLARRRALLDTIGRLDALERDVVGQIGILRKELELVALNAKGRNVPKR